MCEAWADVVDIVVDKTTTHCIPVLAEEAEYCAMSLIVEATTLLLRPNVELDVLLIVEGNNHTTIRGG
jgi:hypothetical protein